LYALLVILVVSILSIFSCVNKIFISNHKKLSITQFTNRAKLEPFDKTNAGSPHTKIQAFGIFVRYSNSSQRKYHQIKNADLMQHSTASISSNVTLFISFSKTLVAN